MVFPFKVPVASAPSTASITSGVSDTSIPLDVFDELALEGVSVRNGDAQPVNEHKNQPELEQDVGDLVDPADEEPAAVPHVRGLMPQPQPINRSASASDAHGLRHVVNPPKQFEPEDFRRKKNKANFMEFKMDNHAFTLQDQREDHGGAHYSFAGIHYNRMNFSETAFSVGGAADDEPSFNKAMSGPDRAHWITACEEEISALERRGAFVVMATPPGVDVIPGLWVLKKKRGRDGKVKRYKARGVAQGNRQLHGQHYFETFAPTMRTVSLRLFLAYIVYRGWPIRQLDVVSAFLIPKLPANETIYMRPLPGMVVPRGHSLKLLRCLYGLKQAARAWNKEFDAGLKSMNFEPTDADKCVYTMIDKSGQVIATLCVHTDDSLIGAEQPLLDSLVDQMMSMFEMTNQGVPDYMLGIGIDFDQQGGTLRLSQRTYVESMLEQFNMVNCKPVRSPAAVDRLTAPTEPATPEETEAMRKIPYRNLVGALMYAMVATRPDITFAVIQIARFNDRPTNDHWTAAKRVLRYLKGTKDYGITFTRNAQFDVEGYSDADYAGDLDSRRSTTGYVFTIMGTPVSWRSKLQRVVALSSCESELIAIVDAGKEALWMRKALRAYKFPCDSPLMIHEDNQGTIAVATNARGMSDRTKHVATRYFAVRDWIDSGEICVEYIPTGEQLADIFTKGLHVTIFLKLVAALGLLPKDRS